MRTGSVADHALRCARAASLAQTALFIAVALARCGAGFAATGLLLALTPLVFFIGSVLNPSGIELAASLAFLAGLPRFARDPGAFRIGVLGVCAGGGYAVNAAMTERRISAVGVVSPINRPGPPRGRWLPRRRAEAAGGGRAPAHGRVAVRRADDPAMDSQREAQDDGVTSTDVLEAVDYFRTPRGGHPHADNQLRVISTASVVAFDAFHLVEQLLTQPLQVVIGNHVTERHPLG